MRAIKCDRCGNLVEGYGWQAKNYEYADNTWPRAHTKGYKVYVRIDPINTECNVYGGLDLCYQCFKELVTITLKEISGATRQLASDTPEGSKQGTPTKKRGPLGS